MDRACVGRRIRCAARRGLHRRAAYLGTTIRRCVAGSLQGEGNQAGIVLPARRSHRCGALLGPPGRSNARSPVTARPPGGSAVSASVSDIAAAREDGQVRLWWDHTPIDVRCAQMTSELRSSGHTWGHGANAASPSEAAPPPGNCVPIPLWYRCGMSKQIAVRLPDDLVDFVDEVVATGGATSRAGVVTQALARERRRAVAQRDAEILARTGPDPDLAGLAKYAARMASQQA